MPEIIPNYHPILVHFTIALTTTAFGMMILSYIFVFKPTVQKECQIVSRWCIWLAALISILTVAAGFHAYYTVAHDTVSHQVMMTHRNWGIATFVAIWIMALWALRLYLKEKSPRWLFSIALAVTFALVIITGWYGAELVYRYGIGVQQLPKVHVKSAVGHQHD